MPYPLKERICENCIYFYDLKKEEGHSTGFGECRYNHEFVKVSTGDWCGQGSWKRFSEITKRIEWYSHDDEDLLNYEEERKLNDPEYQYYVVVWEEAGDIDIRTFRELNGAESEFESKASIQSISAWLFRVFYSGAMDLWNTKNLRSKKKEVK